MVESVGGGAASARIGGVGSGVASVRDIVHFAGRQGLLRLLLKNLAFNILTIGFYRFWARTALRRWLWRNIEILGDPLEYTGTGGELFRGFLRALAFLAPLGLVYAGIEMFADDVKVMAGVQFVFYAILGLLYFIATFLARRYRLSRTLWRGIRLGQDGSVWAYALRMSMWTMFSIVTLGLAAPWARVAQQRYLSEQTLFGDRRFAFDGSGARLLLSWLVVYATLGLGFFWYRVREFRYFAACTSLGTVGFASIAQARCVYARLALYVLLLPFVYLAMALLGFAVFFGIALLVWPDVVGMFGTASLGGPAGSLLAILSLLAPFAVPVGFVFLIFSGAVLQMTAWMTVYAPLLRHFAGTLTIRNPAALDEVAQSALGRPDAGEGLADAFDVGLA